MTARRLQVAAVTSARVLRQLLADHLDLRDPILQLVGDLAQLLHRPDILDKYSFLCTKTDRRE